MKKLDRKKIYIYQNDVPKSYEARQQFTDEVTKRGYTIVDSSRKFCRRIFPASWIPTRNRNTPCRISGPSMQSSTR